MNFNLSFLPYKHTRREMQEFKENKQLSIDMNCSMLQSCTPAISHGCMVRALSRVYAMAV